MKLIHIGVQIQKKVKFLSKTRNLLVLLQIDFKKEKFIELHLRSFFNYNFHSGK